MAREKGNSAEKEGRAQQIMIMMVREKGVGGGIEKGRRERDERQTETNRHRQTDRQIDRDR